MYFVMKICMRKLYTLDHYIFPENKLKEMVH